MSLVGLREAVGERVFGQQMAEVVDAILGYFVSAAHDLIVQAVVLLSVEKLRVLEDLVEQLLLMVCLDPLRQHVALLRLKQQVDRGIPVDGEVLAWLVVEHVDFTQDDLVDLFASQCRGNFSKCLEHRVIFTLICVEEDDHLLLKVLPVEEP